MRGFWFGFLLAYISLKLVLSCLLDALLVDLIVLFSQALIMLLRTSLHIFTFIRLHHMMIQPVQKSHSILAAAVNTGSSATHSRTIWKFASFFSPFREPFVTPIMHSRLYVKERGRDLICWRLPPISFKRLLIDNGKGEQWTLNRHSNYRL